MTNRNDINYLALAVAILHPDEITPEQAFDLLGVRLEDYKQKTFDKNSESKILEDLINGIEINKLSIKYNTPITSIEQLIKKEKKKNNIKKNSNKRWTNEEKLDIMVMRGEGYKLKEISQKYNVSISSICTVINSIKNKGE